jgi:hypothetical protein
MNRDDWGARRRRRNQRQLFARTLNTGALFGNFCAREEVKMQRQEKNE